MQQPNPPSEPGLPPVAPPSGKFIAQLFLVPGLIVVVAVVILWGFSWLAGSTRSPDQFIKDLRSPNVEVRWRAASDLAQVLKRDPQLASNPKFALDIADLLRQNLAAAEPGVRTELQRRNAVFALANLGENLKYVDQWSPERRAEIVAQLEKEAAGAGERARAAQTTLDFLNARAKGERNALDVDRALAKTAKSEDTVLRAFTAFSLNFWFGDKEADARIQETLIELTKDNGRGADESDKRARSLEIRYQAAQALARRGCKEVLDMKEMFLEMLDEKTQREYFPTRKSQPPVTKPQADPIDQQVQFERMFLNYLINCAGNLYLPTAVRSLNEIAEKDDVTPEPSAIKEREGPEDVPVFVIRGALSSLEKLHEKLPDTDLAEFVPAIEKLTKSDNALIRKSASETLIKLKK